MAFDSTVGGPNANSYVSVADADAYIALRLNSSEWTAADTATKQAALVTATSMLDEMFAWRGEPATTTQALHWPATDATDCAGGEINDATIPAAVKNATCEQALYLLKFDATQTPTAIMQGLKSASVGSISSEFDSAMIPAKAQSRVTSILRCYGTPQENVDGGTGITSGYAIRG